MKKISLVAVVALTFAAPAIAADTAVSSDPFVSTQETVGGAFAGTGGLGLGVAGFVAVAAAASGDSSTSSSTTTK